MLRRLTASLFIIPFIALPVSACSSSPAINAPNPQPITTATIPAEESTGDTLNNGRILEPYPYTTPLPPPVPTMLDGIYTRAVDFEGTPTPCRRCAPYRAEGGMWQLILDAGAFRISHNTTDFQGIGSFTVSENELVLFNDPNCHLYVGKYNWALENESLILTDVEDDCAFGLRASNLAAGVWHKQAAEPDKCQPPSTEAAVTGHWPIPEGCE